LLFRSIESKPGQINGNHWVSAWTTSLFLSTPMPGFPAESPITDKTVRVVARPTIGGKQLRIRLSNEFGTAPLTIAAARIALTDQDSSIQPATDHVITFGGSPKITIPAGAPVFSDPVAIAVKPFAEVSISLYLPGTVATVSSHPQSLHDSYFAGPGDMTSIQDLPNPETKRPVYFVSASTYGPRTAPARQSLSAIPSQKAPRKNPDSISIIRISWQNGWQRRVNHPLQL